MLRHWKNWTNSRTNGKKNMKKILLIFTMSLVTLLSGCCERDNYPSDLTTFDVSDPEWNVIAKGSFPQKILEQ